MHKYVLEFSKTGTICYTSHLDMMRFFKRVFKKSGVKLVYSQGFNPHPKMGFAQPLSLGYEGLSEYLEFETQEEYAPDELKEKFNELMPVGLEIKWCGFLDGITKTLAAKTTAADYTIRIPLGKSGEHSAGDLCEIFNNQKEIITLKKQKKKKELKEVDIKPMIQKINFDIESNDENEGENLLIINTLLDQGSISNLSPELVIEAVKRIFNIETDRSEIDVTRNRILFDADVNFNGGNL